MRSGRIQISGAWFFSGLLGVLLMTVCCPCAGADTFKAPDPGNGGASIDGTWQFHTGDNLEWAKPGYDDSGWEAIRGDAEWGAQGHAGYTGYGWYRKRIEIGKGETDLGVWISHADGAYEVYWNGKKIGTSGGLPPHAGWYLYGQDAVFDLGRDRPVSGVLALRFWQPAALTIADSSAGGLTYPPVIGSLWVLQSMRQARLDRDGQEQLPGMIASSVILAAAVLSLVLFLRRRSEWLYLWLAVLLLGKGPGGFMILFLQKVFFIPVELAIQLMVAFSAVGLWLVLLSVFGLSRSKRWRVGTAIVIAVFLVTQIIDIVCVQLWQYAGPGMTRTDALTTKIFTLLGFYVLVLVGFGLAKSRKWSLVPLGLIAVLYGCDDAVVDLIVLINPALGKVLPDWGLHLGSYTIFGSSLLDWLMIGTLIATVALQQIREARRQAHLEREMSSAREVQLVLIPAEMPATPGLEVVSVYKPAAEVGGDFYQVIPPSPDDTDPGTLIVVGDVSGKGLKAAMTVSLIVGTVRTLADSTRSPAEILTGLNRRLLGRMSGGFATCIILRIEPDGGAVVSNAGHLSPYRNGKEWEVPGSLPLGLSPYAEYDEVRMHLEEAETLTMMTDGVLEAQSERGELYGFERLAGLMDKRPTVEEVAEAACSFGQEDDITVLSVTRKRADGAMAMTSLQTAV
jgi:hypothetical protein